VPKLGRRSVREGSVYKYKTRSGATRWRFQVWVPGQAGEDPIRFGHGGFLTAEEADSEMHGVISRTKKLEPVIPKSRMPLFANYAPLWVDGLVTLQRTTIQGYEKNLRVHLLPNIGAMRLDELNASYLNQQFKKLALTGRKDSKAFGAGLSNNTLHKIGTVLSLILEGAVDEGLLAVNPMRKVKLGSVAQVHDELGVWSLQQVKRFLLWNKEVQNDELNPLWHLISFTGIRRGEALALKWGDFDEEGKTLKVVRATDASRARSVKDTKTRSSRRNLKLMEETVDVLLRYKALRGSLEADYESKGAWMFGGLEGQLRGPNDITARWARVLIKARAHFGDEALPWVTLKGLRHSHATTMLEMNINPKVIQERLGHSKFNVTMDTYAHVTRTMQEDAMSELEKRFQDS